MSDVGTWSTTDANNNSAVPNGFPEGMAPSGLNNSARAVMGGVARWFFDTNGSLSAAGTTNTYTLTTNAGFSATAEHSLLVFKIPVKNTGASTLNVDGLGAKAIRKNNNQALDENDLAANQIVAAVYNNTNEVYNLISDTGLENGCVLLASGAVTSSVASISFSPVPTAYKSAMLEIAGLKPATDTANLWLRLSSAAGAADYQWTRNQTTTVAGGTNTATGDTADAQIVIFTSAGNVGGQYLCGRIYAQNINNAQRPNFEWMIAGNASNENMAVCAGGGLFDQLTSTSNLTILFSTGNITADATNSVVYRMYGMK